MSEIPKAFCLMPLLYFQTTHTFYRTRGRFDLRNGIVIRKITASEIQEIQEKRGSKDYPLNWLDIERISYTLEKKIGPNSRASDKALDQFRNLVLSMRLFKQGAVGYKAAFTLFEGRPFIIHDFGVEPRHASVIPIMASLKTPKKPVFALLTLNEKELKEYASFCKEVSKFGGREEKWPLPIRYFSRMYESKPYENALVDCVISFEALIFKGEGKVREKKTPIALAVSMLIGNNSKEREKIKTTLKEAYDIRNAVVHGKALGKKHLEIATLC
ncbi:MAG: HEPN domain-containing protein, partial [Candidatus Bathyarchaeota archaeon]|nr:HEPN domain-containing protein [Candidatus Bathyarchaeota archaeon]